MGITIGDSLSVVATLLGLGVTTWALTLVMGFLFEKRAHRANQVVKSTPWKCLVLGFVLLLTVGTFSVALAALPDPGLKLLGTMGYLWLLSHAAIGLTGVAHLVSDRIAEMDPEASRYRNFVRATGLLVTAGYLPVLGWFAFAPLMIAFSLGAGVLAVFQRGAVTVTEPMP